MRTLEEVKNYFAYHAPDENAQMQHERVNHIFLGVVELLWEIIPPFNQGSPDKTVMFRKLSDARMLSNMCIACFVPPISNPPLSAPTPGESPGQEPVSRP